jgi:phenylacetate-CoA ligase
VSIIVPCYNEAENLLELTERVRTTFEPHGIEVELVLVNDASTDQTGALIDDLSRRHAFVRPVHHTVNRGMTGGWASGLDASKGRYVVIMDGDLQNLPEDVYRLYREKKHSNADIVQGYRSHIGRVRDFRYIMSRVLHYMLRVLFGMRLSDIKCGFFICDREILAHILRRRFSYGYFQTFIIVSAHHKGYRIEEIETLFEERILGESFIASFPWKMILKNLVDLAKGFVEFRLLPADTDIFADFLARHPPARRPSPLALWRRLWLRVFALLMPLHHWKLSSKALHYYDHLERLQWLPPERIRELQEERLRALIKHAYRHVGYHRERFDRLGIDPEEIQRVEDLRRLPILTKQDIHSKLHFDLLSNQHDKLRMLPATTCGSNGEPLTLYNDRRQLEMRWATTLRFREWTGYRFGDRQMRLWPAPPRGNRLDALRAWLDAFGSRRRNIPGAAIGEQELHGALRAVREWRPALLEARAEALLLAAFAGEESRGARARARSIISFDGGLSPAQRARVEQQLDGEVFEQYGSRELSAIAQECERHDGYHVNAESYIVEIVKDGRPAAPGETGDVLITDLTNLSVPLIRYAIGDRATAAEAPCPCGRGLPLLSAVRDRPPALVAGADGRWMPGSFFADVLKDYGHIVRRFQVEQQRRGALVFRVVKGPRFSESSLQRVLDVFRRQLGSGTEIEVQVVDRIEPDAPHTVSSVSPGCDQPSLSRAASNPQDSVASGVSA